MSTSASSEDDAEAEAALTLRHQLIYNGEVLDIALDSIRSYKEGTQSLAYLDSSVYLAWALLRMLEKWGKGGGGGEEMYVRKKKTKKRKRKGVGEGGEGVPDVEEVEVEEEHEEVVLETMFTFEAFEMVCISFLIPTELSKLILLSFLSACIRNSRTQRSLERSLCTLRDTSRSSHPIT
jgi:replication fork protection complex subunit Tof1/Swi1